MTPAATPTDHPPGHEPRRLPGWLVWTLALAAAALLPLVLQQFGNAWVRIADMALLYVLLAIGLNIIVGYAGLLDLGYVAFFAVGAYLFALLASPHLTESFPALASALPRCSEFSWALQRSNCGAITSPSSPWALAKSFAYSSTTSITRSTSPTARAASARSTRSRCLAGSCRGVWKSAISKSPR
jgi:hypothetical protein